MYGSVWVHIVDRMSGFPVKDSVAETGALALACGHTLNLVNDSKPFVSVIDFIWWWASQVLMAWELQHLLCLVQTTAYLEGLGLWITYQ